MKNYKLQTSEGVRDYLGHELLVKEEIESRLKCLFTSYGYNLVKTPTFEYLDVYMQSGVQRPTLYNLINRQGEVLALRNDMTSSIARIVASKDTTNVFPKKYAYIANTFRYPRLYQGKSHEFTQAGIEIIGVSNNKADIEAIKLAYHAVESVNVSKFMVHVGSGAFVTTLLADFGLNDNEIKNVLTVIADKDFVMLKDTLKTYNLEENKIELVLKLMRNAGKLNFLQGVMDELKGYKSVEILDELKTLYNELNSQGLAGKVLFDFSISSYVDYYTGVTFQIFADGIGRALVSGGRCDNLLKTFGKDLPMIGFGLDVDAALECVLSQNLIEVSRERYVSFADKESHEFGLKHNDSYRQKGIIVEVSMCDTLEDTISYAKATNASKVLVYKNNTLEEVKVGE